MNIHEDPGEALVSVVLLLSFFFSANQTERRGRQFVINVINATSVSRATSEGEKKRSEVKE